jgi:hypothetical protein
MPTVRLHLAAPPGAISVEPPRFYNVSTACTTGNACGVPAVPTARRLQTLDSGGQEGKRLGQI